MADGSEIEPVLDAEVVWEQEEAQLPDVATPEATVRQVPTGQECWWRLYSTPTSPMRSRQEHGVRSVSAHRSNPHLLVLELDGWGLFQTTALAWRVNAPRKGLPGTKHTAHDDGSASFNGIESLDLLVPYPPTLPDGPRQWQQMTHPGQLEHPGDNGRDWQYWQGGWEGVGVRFDPTAPGARRRAWDHYTFNQDAASFSVRPVPPGGLRDTDLEALGFQALGSVGEDGAR